nr:hypothetical protein 6 [Piscirickettsiaceae bacterium]
MTITHDECDLYCCEYCSTDEEPLQDYYGVRLCQKCIDFEQHADLDAHEKRKRERIAEQNEY